MSVSPGHCGSKPLRQLFERMPMSTYSPIFEDAETPIGQLLDQVGTIGWRAKSNEVGVIQAAHAIDGEMWAPQLTPYNE